MREHVHICVLVRVREREGGVKVRMWGIRLLYACCFRGEGGGENSNGTVALQQCYCGVTVVLQWRYSSVTVVLQCCYSDFTVMFRTTEPMRKLLHAS
jgi:hypothetical protein